MPIGRLDHYARVMAELKGDKMELSKPPIDIPAAPENRNHLGHWENCPYWDWQDFSKCDCAEGLANHVENDQLTIGPMPLRDFFASQINIPWDAAIQALKGRMVGARSFEVGEIIGIRAQMRYLEADAMLHARKIQLDEATDPE